MTAAVTAVLASLPAYEVDAERLRTVVEEVLDRPAFRQVEPGVLERLRRAVLEALAEVLGGVLTGGTGDLVGWAIAGVAVVVLAVLATRFLRGVSARGAGSDRDRSRQHRAPDPTAWSRAAKEHAHAGRYREASRCRYRALLAELELRGILEDRPGQTVGEETHDLRRTRPAVAVPFADAAELFQAAWYGPDEPFRDDLDRLSRLCDRVLEVAG